MISLLRRYRTPLFIAVIVIFLLGILVGLGGYLFTSRDVTGAVAAVGSTKIPYSEYIQRVNQYVDALRSRGTELNDAMLKDIKQGMLRDMIVDELLMAKADELGLIVTDNELARDIQNTPAFQRDRVFNQEVYFNALRSALHDVPEVYEASRRRQIKVTKLKQLIFQSAKPTPQEVREFYDREFSVHAKDPKGYAKSHPELFDPKDKKQKFPDFEKSRLEFANQVQRQRALDLINYYLRQLSAQVEIRSYLEQREAGT